MGFLVGNDFIPHLPHLHINHDALPLLYRTYISVLPSLTGECVAPPLDQDGAPQPTVHGTRADWTRTSAQSKSDRARPEQSIPDLIASGQSSPLQIGAHQPSAVQCRSDQHRPEQSIPEQSNPHQTTQCRHQYTRRCTRQCTFVFGPVFLGPTSERKYGQVI